MFNPVKTIRTVAAALCVGLIVANAATAGSGTSKSIDEMEWTDAGPGVQIALVSGSWTEGEHGALIKIKAGQSVIMHTHTHDYQAMTIQGNWVHTFGANDARTITPGSYLFQPGDQPHSDACEGTTDCLILVNQNGPSDFFPVTN